MIIYNGTYSVYIHTNQINGKMYIGVTCKKNLNNRWHKGNGYKYNTHFWNAIQKYGWDHFDHEVFASNLTEEEASNMERLLIKAFKTTDPEFGYNIADGGINNRSLSGEHNPFYNKIPTQAIEASVKSRIGKALSIEHRRSISEGMKGYQKTEEHRRKLGDSQRGQVRKRGGDCANSISVRCLETGVIYLSGRIAAKNYNVTPAAICRAIKNKTKCGNVHWEKVL